MEDIRKALDKIAEENSLGNISDDILIKACDAYKIKSDEFDDSYEYHVCVSKSLYDHVNEIEPDTEICKAVVPGQTKVVDGVMYIYAATPNAKTKYDWRVFKGKSKVGKQLVDGSKKSIDKQKYINELFPNDLSTLKVIKKLGGSTGAELVEDAKGNQYVMKKGTNTSNEHIRSEYLVNQLYDLMGLRVPDYELYEENGEAIMLSKFIPMTKNPSSKDYDEMAKGFVVDALLANWDIYQNDNCLIDSAGRLIRVDNGGALNYKAQGSSKTFGDSVVDFDSMIKYNPSVIANLTTQDYIDQINEVLKKRDDVIAFLVESNSNLFSTFDKRFKSLEAIKNNLEAKLAKNNRKILPRKLKSDTDMYKDFSDDEKDALWNNQIGNDYYSKLNSTNYTVGWELLSSICQERGFDARPEVVDEASYWNIVKQAKYQMFRGLDDSHHDADYYSDDFKYNDNCFYGTIGVHGSGIYMHVNDGTRDKSNTQTTYKNSDAYNAARSYAGRSGVILECCLDPKAKVATVGDLRNEILSLVTFDKAAVDAKQIDIDSLNSQLQKNQDDYNNLTVNVENSIKSKMHWDEDTLVMHQLEIDNTDWGRLDDEGNPDYPKFDNFVKTKMFDWVKKNGGSIKEKGKGTDVFIFRLPNSKEPFMLSRFQYENNAIKRKNAFSNAYNYPVKRFHDWLMNNHYKVITKAVEKELTNVGDKAVSLRSDIIVIKSELNKATQEMSDLKKTKNPNGDIISGIYESVRNGNKEGIGTYAALQGYDAIVEPHGNGGPNSFMIVLNRSKVIVKK